VFSHVFIGVTEFERALGFYSAVMGGLRVGLRFRGRIPNAQEAV